MTGDLMAAAEAVADERAFIRLLKATALDQRNEERRDFKSQLTIYGRSKRLGEQLNRSFLEAAAAWAENSPQAAPLVKELRISGGAQQ